VRALEHFDGDAVEQEQEAVARPDIIIIIIIIIIICFEDSRASAACCACCICSQRVSQLTLPMGAHPPGG
jgi:hypothetical protein